MSNVTGGWRQDLKFDLGQATRLERKLLGGGVGEVDDAVFRHGPAVVYSYDNAALVAEVGDAEERSQREVAVGGGEVVHVEVFAAGGGAALEGAAVPGGHS